MTRNLFLGADLRPVYAALADPERLAEVPAAVAGIFNPGEPPGLVQRTDFPARAIAIADEIEATRPDVIGLQEAAEWRTREPGAPALVVVADHLGILEAELARRGLAYRRVAVATNGDVELPSAAGIIVGLTDRDAILVRSELAVSHPCSGNFTNSVQVHTAQGTFAFKRGWAAVDVDLPDGTIRFVTTHLEVGSPAEARVAQELQMGELLEGPGDTRTPVVLAGDFNARPGTPTYERALAGGFDDAWTRAHPDGPPGLTCCHRQPLDDPADQLRARIDLVFTRDLEVTGAVTLGDTPDTFTTAGLWPSDHAGVAVALQPREA
ncbi:MAG: endonuclease/exonuclease/phosphatase family protein [Solirubrobacteraceae bacterium]